MGGGGPFLYALSAYSKAPILSPAFILSGIKSAQKGQKRAKINYFLGCFGVFSGIWETKNGKNKDIFYFRGFRGAAFILFCGGGGRVHWWQVVQDLSRLQDLPEVGSGPFVVCSVLLSAFLLCLWCAMLEYSSISHF